MSDVLDAERVDAVIRKYIAEESERRRTDERDALLVGNYVAVSSAAVRGALTAISWLSSKPSTMKPVKDMETAFEKACEVLAEHGVDPPSGLDRYERPRIVTGASGMRSVK